jgi:hypothetical protein
MSILGKQDRGRMAFRSKERIDVNMKARSTVEPQGTDVIPNMERAKRKSYPAKMVPAQQNWTRTAKSKRIARKPN